MSPDVSRIPDWWPDAKRQIDAAVESFGPKVLQKLNMFAKSPMEQIARKNPYLYRLRGANDAEQFVDSVLSAFVSSSEETMFGDLAEECVRIVCEYAKGGRKSSSEGIDIEYDEGGIRTIIQVKSGPHWGNSSQRKKLSDNFRNAKRIYKASKNQMRCVEGCVYGRSTRKDTGDHLILVGTEFWTEISGWDGCSDAIMEALGEHAANGFKSARANAVGAGVEALRRAGVIKGNAVQWLELNRYIASGRK